MIWFFERHRSRLQHEIRHQPDGHDYELVITHPDGRQEIELFEDASAALERSMRLQNMLLEAGWQPPAPRLRAREAGTSAY